MFDDDVSPARAYDLRLVQLLIVFLLLSDPLTFDRDEHPAMDHERVMRPRRTQLDIIAPDPRAARIRPPVINPARRAILFDRANDDLFEVAFFLPRALDQFLLPDHA